MRVPTPNVSLLELVFCTKKDLSIDKINSAFKNFISKQNKKILEMTEEKLVSLILIIILHLRLLMLHTNVVGKNMEKFLLGMTMNGVFLIECVI